MSILEKVKDNAIIICPYATQEAIMKEFTESYADLHIQLMDKEKFINGVYFTYDASALLYLKHKYQYSFAIGEEILEYLKGGCWEQLPPYPKLENLRNIYQDLVENKQLVYNPYFKYKFMNKTVYIYGYSRLDVEITTALQRFHLTGYYIADDKKQFTHTVTEFLTIEDEVASLFLEIGKLIQKNIPCNHIYLFQYSSEYDAIIKKYANYHHLKIEDKEEMYLYDSPIYKKYVTYIEEHSFEDAFRLFNQNIQYDHFQVMEKLVETIIRILPLNASKTEKMELFTYYAKKQKLVKPSYHQQIRICTSHSKIQEDDYVFLLGFSLGEYPKIIKDTSFYSDEEKQYLGRNSSRILSTIQEEELIQFMQRTKHVHITYKKRNGKITYYPSLLIEKLHLKVEIGNIPNFRYSSIIAKLDVAKAKDAYRNYNIETPILYTYTDEALEYRSYHHHFKGLGAYHNTDVLQLSYSSIHAYYTCPFAYYVKYILKIGEDDENFGIRLGKLYHKVLEDAEKETIQLETYQPMIEVAFPTAKEKFLVSCLLPQVLDVIQKNHDFLETTKYQSVETEKNLMVKVNEATFLTGVIDKIMLDKENKKLIIIDYKTNDFRFQKQKIKYGMDIQLPIYAYLLDETYPQFGKTGLYIQNVCLNHKDKLNENRYKLMGLTVRSLEEVKRLDLSLGTLFDEDGKLIQKSAFIHKCSLKNEGKELASKGYIEKTEMEQFTQIAKEQVLLASEHIRTGEFPISPIKVKGEITYGCSYCKFKDICFVKEEDIRYIDLMEDETDEIE